MKITNKIIKEKYIFLIEIAFFIYIFFVTTKFVSFNSNRVHWIKGNKDRIVFGETISI